MPIVSYPGLYFIEQGGIPIATAPAPSIGAFEGYTKRGKLNELGFVTSWSQFTKLYGAEYNSSVLTEVYTPFAVKQYFDNGGAACWINRIMGAAAVTASYNWLSLDGAAGTFVAVTAVGSGEGGNALSVGSTKAITNLNLGGDWLVGTVNLIVDSVNGFEKGDLIFGTDGTDSNFSIVWNINTGASTLQIVGHAPAPGNVADNSPVWTVSRHRVSTTLAVATTVAGTTATLTDAQRVKVGQIISICDGTNQAHLSVLSKVGNVVTFNAGVGFVFAIGTGVWSQEFNVDIYEDEVLLESHEYLTCASACEDYINTRLSGTDNESNLCSFATGAGADVVPPFTIEDINPYYRTGTALTGGTDVAATTEFTGAAAVTGKTGLYVFDFAGQGLLNFFSLSEEIPNAQFQDAAAYAENRLDTLFIGHNIAAEDSMLEYYTWRKYTTAVDSSYTALYVPWTRLTDPRVSNGTLLVPPDGYVQGVYAVSTNTRGIKKAPANVAAKKVLGLQVDLTDEEQGLLNPIGVNVIRNLAERGYRIWGARTLWTVADGRHYVNIRRVLTYIRTAVMTSYGWVVFEPNDQKTRDLLRTSLVRLLNGLYRDGALYCPAGASPQSEKGAYFVKCDDENNPPETVEAGQLICDIGVRPTPPAEFVIFNLSIISGSVDVSEA